MEERLERASDTARIRQRIREYLQDNERSARVSHLVVLCVDEACTNALKHSGSRRPTEVSVEFRGHEVVAVVTDYGVGLDPDRVNVAALADPMSTGGRGLWLMTHLMDHVELGVGDGLTVRMTKRCD